MNVRKFKRNRFSDLLGARYVLALWLFLGMLNAYCIRNNISVAIVAMVNNTDQEDDRYETAKECGIVDNETEFEYVDEHGDFFWSSSEQGLLLGAFYYGYALTQIIGGWLERKFGGMLVYGLCLLLGAVLTLLSPAAAWTGFWAIFTCRFLLGFVQGPLFPSHHGMWGKWAPPLERSNLISFTSSGTNWGSIIAMTLSGVLAAEVGWESCYYLFGNQLFILFKFSSWKVPWVSIFTSIQVWGLTIGHFCNNWGNYTLLTSLPLYMDQILGFDLGASGFLSSLSSLGIWIFTVFYGWLADVARRNQIMSTLTVRRLLTSLGMFLPAVFLVMGGYIGCNRGLAVALITLAAAFSGCATPGFKTNHVEIAPKYGGILFGISNTAGSISGFMAPAVVGFLTEVENTKAQWQKVFWLSAVLYVIGGFVILGTLKVEELNWAKDHKKTADQEIQIDMDLYDNPDFYDGSEENAGTLSKEAGQELSMVTNDKKTD
ncbi:sialin-like [Glandiceps talaboti]